MWSQKFSDSVDWFSSMYSMAQSLVAREDLPGARLDSGQHFLLRALDVNFRVESEAFGKMNRDIISPLIRTTLNTMM